VAVGFLRLDLDSETDESLMLSDVGFPIGRQAMRLLHTPLPLLLICATLSCDQIPHAPAVASNTGQEPKKLLLVEVGGKWGYIDRAGKIVAIPQYDSASDFSDGLAKVCVGPCDFWHELGYRYTTDFKRESVEQTFKYGYIDETGKMVINPIFENAGDFHEGLAAVCVGDGCYQDWGNPKEEPKWGFIDKTGAMVILPQFSYVTSFQEGLAAVSVGGKSGYIDKTGKFVINPQYDSAGAFENGVAQVGMKQPKTDAAALDKYQYGYIDRTGKYIWQPSN